MNDQNNDNWKGVPTVKPESTVERNANQLEGENAIGDLTEEELAARLLVYDEIFKNVQSIRHLLKRVPDGDYFEDFVESIVFDRRYDLGMYEQGREHAEPTVEQNANQLEGENAIANLTEEKVAARLLAYDEILKNVQLIRDLLQQVSGADGDALDEFAEVMVFDRRYDLGMYEIDKLEEMLEYLEGEEYKHDDEVDNSPVELLIPIIEKWNLLKQDSEFTCDDEAEKDFREHLQKLVLNIVDKYLAKYFEEKDVNIANLSKLLTTASDMEK
jgi:hypothetical protein